MTDCWPEVKPGNIGDAYSWADAMSGVIALQATFIPRQIYKPGMKLIGIKTKLGRDRARRDAEWSAAQRMGIGAEEILAFRKLPIEDQYRALDKMMERCFGAENGHAAKAVGSRVLWCAFMRKLQHDYRVFMRTHQHTMAPPPWPRMSSCSAWSFPGTPSTSSAESFFAMRFTPTRSRPSPGRSRT